MGKPLARDANSWQLGLGPAVVERAVDENLDFLRGAWVVKVDESCRMVSCEFSTQLKPNQPPATYRANFLRCSRRPGSRSCTSAWRFGMP